VYFILGERKEVKIKIISTNNDPFTIRNPSYKLVTRENDLEEEGSCKLEDKEISVLLQPQKKGFYTLEFTYEIAEEILKASVSISVGDG